jgi:hypothetical protein
MFFLFDSGIILYPSLQQKPQSQFLSPNDSQTTSAIVLELLLFILDYLFYLYLKRNKGIVEKS